MMMAKPRAYVPTKVAKSATSCTCECVLCVCVCMCVCVCVSVDGKAAWVCAN